MAIVPAQRFVAIDGGWLKACGLTADGALSCWAAPNDAGVSAPEALAGSFSSFDIYEESICALRGNGSVTCVGTNHYGESSAPDSADFVKIAIGEKNACGIRTNGTIDCWGEMRQIGLPAPHGCFRDIAAGDYHFCAISAGAGKLVCWGENSFKELLIADAGGDFRMVVAGGSHSCALRADSTVTCWGFNDTGK